LPKRITILFAGFLMLAVGISLMALGPAPDQESARNVGAVLIGAAVSLVLLLDVLSR
jgi:uncharacterized membrane protein